MHLALLVIDARIPDPAVVMLNGIVASVAATEVQQVITGFAVGAGPNRGWMYDALNGDIEKVEKPYRPYSACQFHERRETCEGRSTCTVPWSHSDVQINGPESSSTSACSEALQLTCPSRPPRFTART